MLDFKKKKNQKQKKLKGGVLLDCDRLSNKELSRRHFIKTEMMWCIYKSFLKGFWAFKQLIFVFV